MAVTVNTVNPLIGDNFFNANPDRVLGVQTIEHGRFGNDIIKVKGDFSEIEKIDVPPVPVIDLYPNQEFTSENKDDIIQKVFENEKEEQHQEKLQKLRNPTKKTQKQAASSNLKGSQEIYTFREVSELYNKDISLDEMEAYYFTHPDLNYKLLIDGFKNNKADLLQKQLICWQEGRYEYVYNYQSGNISKKISALKRDRDKMIEATSEAQYDIQLKMLTDVMPKQKGLVGEDKLILLPHSDFAKDFRITELRVGPELNANMSLFNAFKLWLRAQPPDIFDKSNYDEVIQYYLDQKNIPIDTKNGKTKQVQDEKKAISIRQRTKEEGDKIFATFLAEELLPQDQAKLAYLWNERYNAFAEPNLPKIPVCFQMSKTFKAGAPLNLNPTQRQAVAFMQEKKSGLLAYGVGVGKAHLMDSDILTPRGFKKMKDLAVGENVIGKNGKPTVISGIFPQGKRSCYEIEFSDGSKTKVSDEHLWQVQRLKQRDHKSKHWDVMTTAQLLKNGLYNKRGNYMFSIPMVEPIHFEEQHLVIDPYIMGCLIGNGNLGTKNHVGISLQPQDMIQRVEDNLPDSVNLYKNKGDNVDFTITRKSMTTKNNVVYHEILDAELNHKANNKFIPHKYLFNSLENRIALLQGLIDTDGFIQNSRKGKKSCSVIYYTVSEKLAQDVKFLCETFGGTASIKHKKAPKYTYNGQIKTGQLCYVISLRLPPGIMPVFTKQKKAKFFEKTKYQPARFIKSISYIGEHDCQCISVTAEDHLYVCEHCIVTHNTISAILCMAQAYYNGFCKKPLFAVPTNTYDNWLTELQGNIDKQTGEFMQGLMPQLPPIVGLYNLNPVIVKEKLKIYSKADQKQFDAIEEAINMIRKMGTIQDFTPKQSEVLSKTFQLNINGIRSQYEFLMLDKDGKGTGRAKNFVEFVILHLKDEYNYMIYDLGQIRDFPDGTIFVTTENGLQRLGVSDKNKRELENSLYKILSQGESTGGKDRAKEAAGLQLKIKQRISSSHKNAKLTIEDLQLDWLCLDEAHYYKKLFTFVKGKLTDQYEDEDGNTKYVRDKSKYELKSGATPSGRALSAYVISHFIQMRNDNRNVVCLTATPFTNSPLEVYSMMVLTNYRALEDMGLGNMTEFFDTFMKINYDIKYTPQKTVKKDIVLTGYNNLSNLRQVIYSMMDKKDGGANIIRPVKLMYPSLEKGIETTIPMTLEQEELIAIVKDYVNDKADIGDVCQESVKAEIDEIDFDGLDDEELISKWEAITKKDFEGDRDNLSDARRESLIKQIRDAMKNDSGADFDEAELPDEESLGVRCLRGISLMRQITLSPYLYHKACSKVQKQAYTLPGYKEFVETSPKLKYTMGCIKSVIDFHKSRNEKISGQVIYMSQGTEFFPLIKQYLVNELHLKDTQVGIVSGGMSKSAKEGVKASFLNGDCLVLIGSQTISVGVNLQHNASVLYNLWYDWNPTDAAQIEGRIWRQGNRFAFVRIVYPQCFNSADPVTFEYLSAKTLRINEIWNRSSEIQELDLKDFNPKELQKKLITDPLERAELEILQSSDRINDEILYYTNRRDLLLNAVKAFKNFTRIKPSVVKQMNDIAATRVKIKQDTALKNNQEKIVAITEKFAAEPEKMIAELTKFNAEKYDHKADPDGKYVPIDYTDQPNEVIYADAIKLADYLINIDYNEREPWGDIYFSRTEIASELRELRNQYKDMKAAEERVLKPMGLSFDTATNPMGEYDAKLADLARQLNAVEDGKEELINRYKLEYKESLKTLKTVDDRIAEFAAANEKLLPPQLILTSKEPVVEDIPHEVVEPPKIDVSKTEKPQRDEIDSIITRMLEGKTDKISVKELMALDEAVNFSIITGGFGHLTKTGISDFIERHQDEIIERINYIMPDRLPENERIKATERSQVRSTQRELDKNAQHDIIRSFIEKYGEPPTRFIKVNNVIEVGGNELLEVEVYPFSETGSSGLYDFNNINDAVEFLHNIMQNDKRDQNPKSVEIAQRDNGAIIGWTAAENEPPEQSGYVVLTDLPKPQKGQRIFEEKKDRKGTIKRVFKPAKGSALEHEPFLVDIRWDDGKGAINMLMTSSKYQVIEDAAENEPTTPGLSKRAQLILDASLEAYEKADEEKKPGMVAMVREQLKKDKEGLEMIGYGLDSDKVAAAKAFLQQLGLPLEEPVVDVPAAGPITEDLITQKMKDRIKIQIDGLTLSREFADDDKIAEIDKQIEALTITLNFI